MSPVFHRLTVKNACLGLFSYVAALNFFFLVLLGVTGDKVNIVYESGQWFHGEKPYADFTQVNLPTNLMILQISHFLGRLVHWNLQQIANLHMYLVLLFCGGITYALRRLLHNNPSTRGLFSNVELSVCAFVIWYTGQISFYMADREFMMMALIFLYMARFSPLLRDANLPRYQRALIGLLAGIGFCMKPHTIILWFTINLAAAIQTRSLRHIFWLENAVVYAAGASLLLYVYLALPEYFTVILPLAREFYGAYAAEHKFANIGLRAMCYLVLLAASVIDWRPKQASPYINSVPYFLVLLGGSFVYAATNNGWGYTLVPAWDITAIIVCLMYKHHDYRKSLGPEIMRQSTQATNAISAMLIISCLITLTSTSMLSYYNLAYGFPATKENLQILQQYRNLFDQNQIKTFASLTRGHTPWYDVAVYTHRQRTLSINHFWMMPRDDKAFERILSGNDPDWRYHYMVDRTVQDIETKKPDMVFSMVPCNDEPKCHYDDILGLLTRMPRFAQLWEREYVYYGNLNTCTLQSDLTRKFDCNLNVYVRKNRKIF